MAWNKPSEGAAKPTPKKPSAMRGVVAGLVVVVAAAAAFYFLFSGDKAKKPVREDTKKGLIKEVAPAAAPKASTNAVPTKPKQFREFREVGDGRVMLYVDGKPRWLHPHWPPSKYGTIKIDIRGTESEMQVEDIAMKDMPSTDLFLAYLFNAQSGEDFGDAIRLDNFAPRFLKSLQIPIIVSKDDPDDVKEIKRGVIELRKELKDRYDDGEDIEKLVKESRDALIKDAQYRRQLQNEIMKMSKDKSLSPEDFEDFVSAANKMLEERGSAKIRMPKALLNRMKQRALKTKQ